MHSLTQTDYSQLLQRARLRSNNHSQKKENRMKTKTMTLALLASYT